MAATRTSQKRASRLKASAARSTVHVETRLDFGFESFEVVVDAAGVDAAEFAEGAVEVGEDDEADGESEYADGVEEDGHG